MPSPSEPPLRIPVTDRPYPAKPTPHAWQVRDRLIPLGPRTLVMGIVNVTPDSFSDGGKFQDPQTAIVHARRLVEEGADILDIGGESTRPGASAVVAAEELRRTEPVVAALTAGGATVSIDTSKVSVAAAALDAGAEIVNDVTAFVSEPELADLCAERGCGVVLMHMQGTPRTMQDDPVYDDVVDDVKAFLGERIELAVSRGVAEERIWVDPGIGFGKTLEHNLELLGRLAELRDIGRPILIGTSRKSFLGKLTGREPAERLGGTIASNVLALLHGTEIFRVHDVRAVREALVVAESVLGTREWGIDERFAGTTAVGGSGERRMSRSIVRHPGKG